MKTGTPGASVMTSGRGFASPLSYVLFALGLIYVIQILFAVFTARHWYGDGAWFLVKMLSEGHVAYWHTDLFRDFFVGRIGAFLYLEGPTVLAARLGLSDISALSVIFGLTLFSVKPLSLAICYRYATDKRAVLFPLAGLFLGTMNSEAYIVSETHLFTAAFWAAAFILLSDAPLRKRDHATLIVAGAPLILCYEAMALFGLLLCTATVYRMKRASAAAERAIMWGWCAWFALGSIFGVLAVVFPRDAANRQGFITNTLFLFRNEHISARVSAVVLVLIVIIMVLRPGRAILNTFLFAAAGLSVLIVTFGTSSARLSFNEHVVARSFNLVTLLLTAILFWLWREGKLRVDDPQFRAMFLMVATVGVGQCAWSIVASTYWSKMLDLVRYELKANTGPIPFSKTLLAEWTVDGRPVRNLHADWPLLPLSILMSPAGNVSSMIDLGPGAFRPFNPMGRESLPDLQQFGISYKGYLQALAQRKTYELGQTISFDRSGNASTYIIDGWSWAEEWGTWTDGPAANLALSIDDHLANPVRLAAVVGAFVNEKSPELHATVYVNGVSVGRWSFVHNVGGIYKDMEVLIPSAILTRAQPAVITFRVDNPASPAQLGLGGDPRRLGLSMVRMKLEGARPAKG